MQIEEWKTLPLPCGLSRYSISNLGRVQNVKSKKIVRSNRNLAQNYLQINLHDNITHHNMRLARLVWLTFTGEDNIGRGFDHKDGNWKNCALENLIPRRVKS